MPQASPLPLPPPSPPPPLPPAHIPSPPPPLPPPLKGVEWAKRPDLRFDRCAVVGSGRVLRHKRLGSEIDAHDVVVHVNNVPDPEYREDAGSRTDILFTTMCALSDMSNHDEIKFEIADGGEEFCWSRDPCHNVKGVVFRSPFDPHNSCAGDHGVNVIRDASEESAFGLGFSSLEASQLAWHVRRADTPYCCDPSTGFHAVLTMALECNHLDLYGFSGSTTIDGHGGEGGYLGHEIEKEHLALYRMIDHTLAAGDYTDALRDRWTSTNLTLKDPH
eukprot:1740378-Prymnesium_polylepis.1